MVALMFVGTDKGFDLDFDISRQEVIDGKGAWRDNVFVERIWRSITCL